MALGYFSNSVHYMKIYSRLKISFAKYKTTLNYDDDNEPEDIIAFLRTLLTCFGQILEITGVTETSKIAEEILSYMQTIFHLEPTCTITCVHQLLKSLFGSNLLLKSLFGSNLVESHRSDIIRTTIKQQKQRQNENQRNADRQDDNDDDDSDPDTLYYVLSRFHYENILNHFELIRSKWFSTIGNETYYDSGASSKLTTTPSSSPSFRKREKRQIGPNKSTDKMLANYIRLFESMVIGSLKHYTITSDVQVQCAVLRLLNQLVRLKVNYCLLDSEQVFIKFIQKQFEYIEDGLVMNPEKLIPNMFDFLTSLSHGKQHSKSIIGVPKIIQLCDGLMASEQSPSTCCIPALKPIVEDVFLTRCSVAGNNAIAREVATTTGELDELEIAREVLLSMLLRLFEYAEVLDLLRIILLNEARRKTAADRWYKWSMQMWDVFVAKLTDCKLKLDNSKDMLAILRWLVALHPGLFRRSLSINELLAILFRRFPIKEKNIIMISRWLGKIIVIMTIVVQLSEAELLKATRESLSNFSPEGTFDCISDRIIKSDPLNVTKVENDLQGFNVESVFAKFIFRVLEIASAQCALAARQSQDTHFLVEQLSHLLFICCEIYQSDNYPILLGTSIDLIAAAAHRDSTTTTVSPYRDMLETIDGHIFNLGKKCPILIYQWCAIRNMLKIEKSATTVSVNSTKSYFIRSVANTKEQLYLTLTTSALLFSYSEYLIEEAAYKETLSEFIQVNVFFIVWYCEEPPITELISIIHRDITTSRILIEHISNMIIRQSNILEPHFIIRLLNVLQNCHESHTGSLIMLLTIDVIRRCCRHLAVLRMVVNVTCRKLEYLLTLHVDEIRRQMSESDLNRIVHHIVETKLASMKKNKTILGLLSKLSVQIYATNQQQQSIVKLNVLNAPVTTGFGYVRDMKIDKRCTDDEGETNEALCQMINVEDVAEINEKKDDQEIKTIFLTNVLKVFATNMVNRGGDVDGSRTSQNKRDRKKNPLLQMSIHTVFNDIAMFLKKYREKYRRHRHSRRQHQIQDFEDRRMTTSSEEYSRQNVTLLEEQEEESGNVRRRNLIEIVKIVTTSFAIINRQICDDDDDESTLSLNRSLLVSFCVVCLESIASTVRAGGSINVDYVSNVLECTERMLRVPQLTFVLTLRSHLSWLCSIVDSLHRLLVHFCPSPDDYGNDTDDDEAIITAKRATISNVGGGGRGRRQWTMEKKIQRANRQLEAAFIMVTSKNAAASARRTTLPRYLYSNVKSIVIRISTMSPFKSYLLTPTNLWKGIVRPAVVCATATVTNEQDDDDDAVDGTASNQTITEELLPPPPLPVDFLKDYDILSEYNFRITQLGWTDRKDFEETWMSLLSILNSDLIEDRSGSSSFSSSSTCFVIKVVTALLGRTLMSDTTTRALINTSCINESATFFHVPRDLPIWPSNEEVSLTKLKCVQDKLELLLKKKKNKMGGEKLVHDDSLPSSYYCGQISVAYLLLTLRKGTVDGEGEEEDVIDDDDEEENYPLMKLYNGRRAKEAHLDINSCIQSLLDIYTQWLQDSNKVKNVPVTLRTDGNDGGGGGCSCSILNEVLKSILVVSDLFHHRSQFCWSSILNEVLKSILVVSDLFHHRSQFCWMLDTLVELVKTHTHHQQHQQQQQQHSVMEDDIISNRYLIVGICKAVAVLNPDMEIYELIKRILNHNLIKRSSASSVSVRLSCFYGLLYMLEGCVLNNTVIGGLTEELQFVLSLAIQHIDYYNNSINKKDGKHRYDDDEECLEITVWALKFYIIENIHDNQLPSGFVNTTIQSLLPDLKVVGIVGGTSTRTTTTTPVNYTLHSSLMKAMERLVLKRRLPTNLREQTLNLALHNIKNGNTLQSFLAIQLMITCMYIGDDDDERKGEELSRTTSLRIKDRRTSPLSSSSLIESDDVVMTKNPEHLMRTIEKVSVIFERIRRGLPLQDVEILSRILPHIIEDFFSPADILTKIVGEFLSPQQKYPALLSRVLFVVFGKGIERSQLPLLQDWVVISLSNFTQTLSTGTAVWYLTCFFISTSENFWLRSVFAYVRSRFGGRLEMEDREMLCIAGRDFYNRLASDRQRRIFIDTFKKAAEDDRRPSEESVPFRDLLDVCSSSP
ncbi:Huntingtin protein region [Popillia japonica]|uniref:Huntingtin protein region n=1 Tax=Popillia japonica TaxID=7064 RepID=A0AAW1HSH8_POPJA